MAFNPVLQSEAFIASSISGKATINIIMNGEIQTGLFCLFYFKGTCTFQGFQCIKCPDSTFFITNITKNK